LFFRRWHTRPNRLADRSRDHLSVRRESQDALLDALALGFEGPLEVLIPPPSSFAAAQDPWFRTDLGSGGRPSVAPGAKQVSRVKTAANRNSPPAGNGLTGSPLGDVAHGVSKIVAVELALREANGSLRRSGAPAGLIEVPTLGSAAVSKRNCLGRSPLDGASGYKHSSEASRSFSPMAPAPGRAHPHHRRNRRRSTRRGRRNAHPPRGRAPRAR